MNGPEKSFLRVLWQRFRFLWENRESKYPLVYRGKDVHGNVFFESQAKNPHGKPSRFHFPPKHVEYLNKLSPEWEAWLRHRRDNVPTSEELEKNLERAKIRKENANKRSKILLEENPNMAPRVSESTSARKEERLKRNEFNPSFPKYPEYQTDPSAKSEK